MLFLEIKLDFRYTLGRRRYETAIFFKITLASFMGRNDPLQEVCISPTTELLDEKFQRLYRHFRGCAVDWCSIMFCSAVLNRKRKYDGSKNNVATAKPT